MRQRLVAYDFFMYIEDDMLVSWDAILRWHLETQLLSPTGFLRGFLRVEKNRDDVWMATDVRRPMKNPPLLKAGGQRYISPTHPYHAFWIYTREQMEEFVETQAWLDGDAPWDSRASAAAGMMFSNPPRSYRHRVLLPIDDDLTVAEDVRVVHLPNTYAIKHYGARKKFGTVPAQQVLRITRLARMWHALRGGNAVKPDSRTALRQREREREKTALS